MTIDEITRKGFVVKLILPRLEYLPAVYYNNELLGAVIVLQAGYAVMKITYDMKHVLDK